MHAALITALVLGSPAAAGSFCDTLHRVIAAAPGDFEALGGGVEVDAQSRYTDAQLAPGQLRCVIGTGGSGWERKRLYQCVSFARSMPNSGDVEAMAEQVGKCIGAPMRKKAGRYSAQLPGATVDVRYDTIGITGIVTTDPRAHLYFVAIRVFPSRY